MPSRDPDTGRFISGQADSQEEGTPQVVPPITEVEPGAPVEDPLGVPIEDHPGDPIEDDYPDEEDYEDEDEMQTCTVCGSEEAEDRLYSELDEDAIMCQSCYEEYYSCDICETETEMHNTIHASMYVTYRTVVTRAGVRICSTCYEERTQRHPGLS